MQDPGFDWVAWVDAAPSSQERRSRVLYVNTHKKRSPGYRERALQNWDGWCFECERGDLEEKEVLVHHMTYYPENLVVMCRSCHKRVETELARWLKANFSWRKGR